jgi:hypothetical protein
MLEGRIMAHATALASGSNRSRRWRVALLLAGLLLAAATVGTPRQPGVVYIWRDADGGVRFSRP